jgi:hypothetical protein
MNTIAARLAALEHRWPGCGACNGVLTITIPIARGTPDETIDWSPVERERVCPACRRARRLRVYQLELDGYA